MTAYVVSRRELGLDEIRAHCASRLAPYKHPRRVHRVAELLGRDLARVVDALLELVDPLLADVEADGRDLATERQRDGEADVSEADDRDLLLLDCAHRTEESTSSWDRARCARVRCRVP